MDVLLSRLSALWARIEAGPLGVPIDRMRRRWNRGTDRVEQGWRQGSAPARPVVDKASAAGHKAAEVARPGTPPILYRDRMITLDQNGVVVSGYYLPFGRHRIPYASIHEVREHPLTRGRQFRLHGFAWPRYWYHRDARRAERSVGLELRTDTLLWPVLTPKDVDAVKEIITEHVDGPARST
jgi:hypothetical protein